MIAGTMLVVAVLFVIVIARGRRRATLAGRRAEKPVYSIEPPARRIERGSRGVL